MRNREQARRRGEVVVLITKRGAISGSLRIVCDEIKYKIHQSKKPATKCFYQHA
jgi:hypothetical protein